MLRKTIIVPEITGQIQNQDWVFFDDVNNQFNGAVVPQELIPLIDIHTNHFFPATLYMNNVEYRVVTGQTYLSNHLYFYLDNGKVVPSGTELEVIEESNINYQKKFYYYHGEHEVWKYVDFLKKYYEYNSEQTESFTPPTQSSNNVSSSISNRESQKRKLDHETGNYQTTPSSLKKIRVHLTQSKMQTTKQPYAPPHLRKASSQQLPQHEIQKGEQQLQQQQYEIQMQIAQQQAQQQRQTQPHQTTQMQQPHQTQMQQPHQMQMQQPHLTTQMQHTRTQQSQVQQHNQHKTINSQIEKTAECSTQSTYLQSFSMFSEVSTSEFETALVSLPPDENDILSMHRFV